MLRMLLLLGWMLISGADCRVLTGPNEEHGHIGSSIFVICSYKKSYEHNTKFWCKQKQSTSTCYRSSLIKSVPNKKVKDGRVSIEDNRKYNFFSVSMDNLQLDDSGTYQCGIERVFGDIRHEVTVTVSPAPTLKPEDKSVTTEPPGPDPAKETPADVPKSTLNPKEQSSKPDIILRYCVVVIFSLLLLATVVLIIMARKKRTGSCVQRKKEAIPSNTVTVYSTVDPPRKNMVPDHPTSTNRMGLYSNDESNPESNGERIHSQRKALEKRNEVTYATLMIPDLQKEAVYANIDPSPSLPQTPTQDVFYTEVKKKRS